MNKQKLLIVAFLLVFSKALIAQTVVGAWKTVSNVLVKTDGSKNDLTALQWKRWPCLADLQTIFDANGKQYMKSEKKCGPLDYNKLPAATWKMNNNSITITNSGMPNPLGNTAVYKVTFLAKTVVFTHVYTPEEQLKLHDRNVKEVIITYQRL